MSVTTIRLQADVELDLQNAINSTQRSKNWLINQAIREFVSRQNLEQMRWAETLQAMESVAQGKVLQGEQVHAWLQTWGTDKELSPPEVGK
jgi:predicted transcriptional regulator